MFKFTVITTVKNGMEFIDSCISSLDAQTCQDFIHIIIDDGSDDGSFNYLIKNYSSSNRFIYKNIFAGRINALNFGISICKTPFIAILDIDDLVHPNWIEFYSKYSPSNLDKFDVITSNSINHLPFDFYHDISASIRQLPTFKLLFRNYITHSGVVINFNNISKNLIYKGNIAHDYELWVSLAVKNFRFGYTPYNFVFHRIHSNQFFEKSARHKYIIKTFKIKFNFLLNKYILFLPIVLPVQFYGAIHSLVKGYLRRKFL